MSCHVMHSEFPLTGSRHEVVVDGVEFMAKARAPWTFNRLEMVALSFSGRISFCR